MDLHPAKSGPTIYLKISDTLYLDEVALLKLKGNMRKIISNLSIFSFDLYKLIDTHKVFFR